MDDEMQKLGVDEQLGDQERLEKQAAEGCPECGGRVERHGQVLICEQCGSRPFEKKR
jgi:DNA-directed RNA polymerase subunit RPC12/RpoP